MPDIKINQSRVYNALKGMGYKGIGDNEEQFAAKMGNPKNREKVYNALSGKGYKGIGKDLASFEKLIYQEPAQPQEPNKPGLMQKVGDSVNSQLQNIQQPQSPTQKPQKKGAYEPTWQEKMAMGITMDAAKDTAENASAGIDEQVKNAETYQKNVYGQNAEIGKMGRVVEDGGGYITDDATKHNVLVDANQEQRERDAYINAMRKQQEEYTEPSLLDTIGKSIGSGFLKVGEGILNGLQQLSSGMIVEDASSPTGYTKTQEYDPTDQTDAVNRGISAIDETANRLSRQAQPKNGKGFLDMLWDGEIGSFLQKGVAVAGESLPMTLSAFNPTTMILNGLSMAGNNFREQTLENPDTPTWKRAAMAIGSAAIEQAVEKYADPVFKYVGGGKILKKAGKEASEEITKEVTKKATETLAKRIFKGMGGIAKDAAGEGAEEVITNFGNDLLGQALDLVSGRQDYGLEAQWADYRKNNPDASLWDFAQSKAKENVESFIGGAMAGAYTSGSTQLTVKGIEYGLNHIANEEQILANPNARLSPITVDLGQSFDEGYTMEGEKDVQGAREAYEAQRQQAIEMFGEIRGLDEQPLKTLETMQKGGFTPEQIQAAYDYISAKATFDGIQQRMMEEQKRSRVTDYNINGNIVEEVDGEGNVVATHEYESQEAMKLGLWELQARRTSNDIQADISMVKLNPKYDYNAIIGEFAKETELDVDYIESILNKDPMELDDPEGAMVSEFYELIHNTLYGEDTLHEEQSAEDGANVADSMSIDMEDENPSDAAAAITDSWNRAKLAREGLFATNEELAQEVLSREQQGMPSQGIISSLDTFSEADRQTVIDYYNQKAKFEGFMNRMEQKINEEAHNSRERHTLNGTINGQADVRNVYTITDGTNEYFLVSGNITTDADGKITGSDSGLIIGMDLDGSFVQLGDTNGYSVMPSTMSLDQFEEAERIRLQEQMTSVIDPNQTMMPQGEATEQPVAEAGDTKVTGGDEATAAPSVPETAVVGTQEASQVPESAETGTQQAVQIPVDEKTGVKLYEQGVPVDQAIDDMIADGLDVNEEADLAINEARVELSKIKEPKTRAERVKNAQRQQELQTIIDYYNNVKARYAELNPPVVDATPYVDRLNKAKSRKEADAILNEALQAGVKAEDIQQTHTEKVSDLISKDEEARRRAEEVTENDLNNIRNYSGTPEERASLLDKKKVPNAEKRRKMAKLIYGELFDDDFEAYRDVNELISMWLGKGRQLDPDSFGQELGWDMGVGKDAAKVSTMFTAKRENGGDGMLFNDFVHMVMENSGGRFTTEDIRNALISMFQGAQEKSDLTEYQLQSRIAEAENRLAEEQAREEGAAEDNVQEDTTPIPDGGLPFAPENQNETKPAFLGEEEQKPAEEPKEEKPQQQAQSREEYLASHPLTEEQIMADTEATDDEKLNAIDFLKGEDDSAISRFYYDGIYNRVATESQQTEQKPIETENPVEAIEQAAQSFRDRWQYNFHYDKNSGRAWITRDDVSGPIPIGDGRFRIEGKNLEELRGILENPANNLGDILKEVEVQLHNAEVGETFRKVSQTRKEQKSQDQADIDAALKEFSDFLDNAKGTGILDKFMHKGIEGNDKVQANLLDAFTLTNEAQRMFLKDLLRLASKVGYAYIKSGVHDAQAWAKKMSDSIGRKLNEVLGWDEAIINEFVDEVWNQKYTVDGQRMRLSEHAERLNNDKSTDQTVNVHKEENNEAENVVSLQQKAKPSEELEGDSAEFVERERHMTLLSMKIFEALQRSVKFGISELGTMRQVRSLAHEEELDDLSLTDLQELVEAQVVRLARKYAQDSELTDKEKFEKIQTLYNMQPTLSARDNDRINKQQYSTPAPMAFLMGRFVDPKNNAKSGLEPSAGNGMLTVALPKEIMHVNDIDEMRLSNLSKQGFAEVTSQDGTQPFKPKAYDVIVTNPPFGNVTPKVYEGIYEISGLEHQMAINALESMKDDGKAAIIIGGNTEYNTNGSIKGKDRIFLNYLYSHYNVVDVINMDGKSLYTKQGTGYPVRMILINGRKEFDPKSYAPVKDKARAEQVKTYDELYKRISDDILSDSNKSAGVHNAESGESNGKHDNGHAESPTETGVQRVHTERGEGQHNVLDSNGQRVQLSEQPTNAEGQKSDGGRLDANGQRDTGLVSGTPIRDGVRGPETSEPNRTTSSRNDEGRDGRGQGERMSSVGEVSELQPSGGANLSSGGGSRPSVEVRRLGAEKVPYRQQSKNPYSLQSQMPAEQADVVKNALEELGDVDEFLVRELGYSSVEDMYHGSQSPENHGGLAAEQVDSVAMAIHQMNQGNAFIIGDQTGVGKGRQAAALIRYGVKKGGCPVFISVKKGLFSDMYRDLCDIGSPELRPFIWSADDQEHSADVTDKDGNVVYKRPSDKEQKRVVEYINKHGKLPPEYDYIVTTYDSFKGGTMTYEEGKKEPRKFAKGKSATTGAYNSQAKRDALERLAENSYVIMDESHNAGGETSAVSGYLQYITTRTKGVTFLSATFAKRPGNMPIYSLKTAISKAGVKVGELIDAVKRGGATFQEVMSKALTEAGQMIRRERNMEGVTIDWRGIEDEDVIQKQREQYDAIIGLFNDIINFQRSYVDPIVNGMNDDAADAQGAVDHTPGTRDMGINNTPFASRTYNMVQQVLLSLKAEETAKRAIEHLKGGRKPVITVANTNEGAADEAAGMGENMEMPDLSVNLKKGLRGTLRITKKDAFDNESKEEIPFEKLSEEGQKRYAEIMDAIERSSSGLSLSPIDVIKNELKKAGYKVGELTGRKAEFVYNEDGTVNRTKRQDTDKKRIAADFNNGKIDALILNKSAGTGISLHASTKFKDQRQRIMIVAQAQGDVNDEVQIRGRIDRTGQVLRGMYEYVVSQIPSEQRLLMMLKAKLRSLDANTTSSQKSKFNEMQVQDIINKYGDDIVIQYLSEHPDLAAKMVDPLKWGDSLGEGYETMSSEVLVTNAKKQDEQGQTASKVLGRMALLTVKEQEKMLAEIGDMYQAEIDRLNEMGENDLEITEMPLKAKTLKKDIWEEGVEPGGKNPFADNSYVEEVEMDILKKPMKAEEVKKSQERLLGGKTWEEYKQEQLDKVDKWAEEKKAESTKTITERAEKKAAAEQEKYVKGAKKAQDKNQMTDAEIERNGQIQYDNIYKMEMEKLNAVLEAVDKQKETFVDAFETFTTDGVYALPTDIYDLSQMTFEPSFGKVIDIKVTDNFSTAASTITFATLDGRRKITIPISGMVKQHNGEKRDIKPVIVSQTAQTRNGMFGSNIANMLRVLEQNIDNWDKLTSTATRKKGYIITGNLLKALTELRKQGKGGKLISYTTDTGDIRQGILMSDNFDPKALTSKNPISSAKGQLDWVNDKITSADGDVTIKKDYGGWYKLSVPKSKKKGDRYFNDEVLLSLVYGNQFEGSTKMSADFQGDNLDAILKRLDELGVTVESANEEKEAISTPDPMQAINQAADSWRRSAKESESSLSRDSQVGEYDNNSVPLERRTLKSYTDNDGNYYKGIEEELGDLEAEIAKLERGEDAASPGKVGQASGLSNNRRRVNNLRREASKLRAEIARRAQNRQTLQKKYNIDSKGNISLNDVRNMFNDLNSNKVLGKIFDKVFDILDSLGTQFRFTDNFDALTGGEAFGYFNSILFNWDRFSKGITDQMKAKTILHEMIHGIAFQLLDRYEDSSKPKLSAAQEKVAKQIFDIYKVVKKANPKYDSGASPYGLEDAHEMLSELSTLAFRKLLDNIPYREGMSVWQRVKEWLKDVLGSFGFDVKGNTALDSLNKALDDILDNYDEAGINEYKDILSNAEQDLRDAGYTGDIMDLVEENFLDGGGTASKIEDEELISKLEAEPKITTYRAMKKIDGGYYAPMATNDSKTKKLGERSEEGVWMQADEHPEKAFSKKNADGEDVWYFRLQKSEKANDYVDARYNPYIHSSTTMLNDQFKSAETHPDLVVVELEIPESELTSGYKADKAKDSVGMLPWTAGTIQKQLTGTRQVMLSRYAKIKREVPVEEYAKHVAKLVEGQVEVFPSGIVTPEQRKALEAEGIKFVKTNGQLVIQEGEHKGENYEQVYAKKAPKRKKKSSPSDPMEAINKAAKKWRRSKASVDDGEASVLEKETARQKYENDLKSAAYIFEEAYRDSMIALKKAQFAIGGEEISDSQNAYMAENQMHSKNKIEQDWYMRNMIKPLIDTMNKIMEATGMSQTDIESYVYTKSALERNRQLFVRDFIHKRRRTSVEVEPLNAFEQDILDNLLNRIETDFEDGFIEEEERNRKVAEAPMQARNRWLDDVTEEWNSIKQDEYIRLREGEITFAEYLSTLDNYISDNFGKYNPSKHDYSGLTDMYGDESGKYKDAGVVKVVMVIEAGIDEYENLTEELWGHINDATQFGIDREHDAGLISDESYKRATDMFHWYIPLRGFEEKTAEDMYQYLTEKGKVSDYVGKTLKYAGGRKSKAKHPIATIFAMANNSIARSNRNLVKQKFYRLVNAHDNDLVTIMNQWIVKNAEDEWVTAYPDITDDMNDRQIRAAVEYFENEMREKAKEGKAQVVKGKSDIPYRVLTHDEKSEHIIEVSINGQRKMMVVNGNPRVAQALNGLTSFERGKNIVSKLNGAIKNWMASVFTNYSITFGMRNMMRDWTHFRVSLSVREGMGYANQAAKYYRKALPKMHSLFVKYRENTLDMNNEMERDFKDFMDNGGVTGYVQMKKVDEWQKEMDSIIKKMNAGKAIKFNDKLWEKILGAVEGFNEAIENTARFATYRASRHYAGRTKARSAYDAKEVTVNFNRKGAGYKSAGFKGGNERAAQTAGMSAQVIGEGRLFFNATIQAIANVFKGFRNADGSINKDYVAKWAARFALPPFMLGLMMPYINQVLCQLFGGGGDGDDPYANLPEWTRRHNICIWVGDNNFITIPIGQELAAFMALGDIVAGQTYKPELKPVDRTMDEEIADVLSTFSPIDFGTKLTDSDSFWEKRALDLTRPFSVIAPVIAIGTNYGWTGRPIYRTEWGGTNLDPEYQKVYNGTNPILTTASKALHELGGGDEVSRGKGWSEINPAVVQYLWEQYTGGPGKFISNAASIGKDIANWSDNDFNIRKVEGLKAFIQQGDDRTKMYRTQAKYFNYKKNFEKLEHDVSGYQKRAEEDPNAYLKLQKIASTPDFVRLQIIKEVDKELGNISKAANAASGSEKRELRELYNEQLRAVVEMLDEVGKESK